MLKKVHITKKNLFKTMLVAIVAIFTLIGVLNTNKVVAYNSNQLRHFGTYAEFTSNPRTYCLDYRWPYAAEADYLYVSSGSLDVPTAYLVKLAIDGTIDRRVAQEYIWEYGIGDHSMPSPTPDPDFVAATEVISNLKTSGNISINNLTDGGLVLERDNGTVREYGPFNITYPCVTRTNGEQGIPEGLDVKVLLNGKELEQLPKSGEDFYLTEADGIIVGEKNTIKVVFNGNKYSGTYKKYVAQREVYRQAECIGCHATTWLATQGVSADRTLLINESIGWYRRDNHRHFLNHEPECEYYKEVYGDYDDLFDGYYRFTEYTDSESKKHQDLIEVEAIATPITEEKQIEFYPGRKITITLNKIDNTTAKHAIEDIKFNASVYSEDGALTFFIEGEEGSRKTTTEVDGHDTLTILTWAETGNAVVVELEEQESIFYIKNNKIQLGLTWGNGTWALVENSDAVEAEGEGSAYTINIINKAKINDVTILKVNRLFNNESMAGITFNVTLNNAKTENGGVRVVVTTDSKGELALGMLEVLDPTKPVEITLEEVKDPKSGLNYGGLAAGGEVTISIMHKQGISGIQVLGSNDTSLADASYDLDKNIVKITAYNDVSIDLSGKVWLDGQTGLKPVKAPNGLRDSSENGISGVKVVLKRGDTNQVVTDKNGKNFEIITGTDGSYSFKEIPTSFKGDIEYYIEFTYDGINYVATTANAGNETIDSDATEVGRTDFNNKFHTIEKDKAVSTDGKTTSLEYNLTSTAAELKTLNNDGTVQEKFALTATTKPTTYKVITENIDLGLVKKGVDLAAVTDIYQAVVKINGESKTYTYNDIISLEDNIVINRDPEAKYSLYLYSSDYNYRIKDYSALPLLGDHAHTEYQEGNSSSLLQKKKQDGELTIELTYQVLLNNQSATDATINKIAYYYDTSLTSADGYQPELVQMNGKTYNKIELNVGQTFTDQVNQGIGTLTFTTTPQSLGNITSGKDIKNWVEITSYSTNDGCIDSDSAPDNITTHQTEDDTDDARGLTVTINGVERQLSGYVFEDLGADGNYTSGDGLIDDVIVQLIEIKQVEIAGSKYNLEYIWQETVAGHNTVKRVKEDGTSVETYTVDGLPAHYYAFQGFIPGDYIIRFIYGDGTYYDTAVNGGNILKYNGQDYKSTIDANYNNKRWYKVNYAENASMARDNEARRLEEMDYANKVTSPSDLVIDSKNKLANTWMCAETSFIEIPVSDLDNANVQQEVYRNINFGLTKRTTPELTLEKHLTYLKINGVTEAKTSIENYISNIGAGTNIESSGEGVFATATDKATGNRGSWLVQTSSEAIAGKNVEIEYTYLIRNTGKPEYVGTALVDSGFNYDAMAQIVKQEQSNATTGYSIGTYIGTEYYTGKQGASDREVGITFKVEDYLDNSTNLQLSKGNFKEDSTSNSAVILNTGLDGNEQTRVLKTDNIENLTVGNPRTLTLGIAAQIDPTGGNKTYTYRSYVAQLVTPDSGFATKTGKIIRVANGGTLGNLKYVQSYAPLSTAPLGELTPEADEFVAETVEITVKTGSDRISPIMLAITISAGLAVVAAGIVLIKKYVIK